MKFSSNHLTAFLITVFIITASAHSFAQSAKLKTNVSFAVNNVTVSDALESLTTITGFTFSYNPDQIPASRIVKVDMHNRPLSEVLEAILGSKNFGYRVMANQIVIYRLKEVPEEKPAVENTPVTQEPKQPIAANQEVKQIPAKTDTVYVTVNTRDTVVIKQTDTVYQKVPTPVSGNEAFRTTSNLKKELTPVWKADAGISLSYFFPSASYSAKENYNEKINQYEKSYSNNTISGSAGLDIRFSYNKITLASGVAFTVFGQKLDYSYLKVTGGFFRKDTLDRFYTLAGADTTWYYILDSTYIPKDNETFNYRMNNHFRYLEIPLTVQYNYGFRNVLFFAKGGLITGFYTGSDGQQILPDENGIMPIKEITPQDVVLSYTLGAGVAVPIGSKLVFSSSVFYRSQLESIYKDFPIETRYSATGISAGLIYKLY